MTTRRPLTSAQSDRAAGVLLATACGFPLLPADDTPDQPVGAEVGAGARATETDA